VRDNDDIGGSHLSCRRMQSGLIDDGDSMGSQCGALGRVPRLAHLRLMFFQLRLMFFQLCALHPRTK
jgi:hypothetical protein